MQKEMLLIPGFLSSLIHPLTNDNKCLQRDRAALCQDFEYFMIFYHPDYISHKTEINAIRIFGCCVSCHGQSLHQ